MDRPAQAPSSASVRVVLFTRDLRVDDQPALAAAGRHGGPVVGLFVLDERILSTRTAAPRRVSLLIDALTALRAGLEKVGSRLIVRRGDLVEQAAGVVAMLAADELHLSCDVSPYARERRSRLAAVGDLVGWPVEVVEHPGIAVVAPGMVTPAGGDHFKVFTPYLRRWAHDGGRTPVRPLLASDAPFVAPLIADQGAIPEPGELVDGAAATTAAGWRPAVDEASAHARLEDWIDRRLDGYGHHDELERDASSGLSAALHLGSISPARIVERILEAIAMPSVEAVLAADDRHAQPRHAAAAAFLRQLCWRDFHLQLMAARPELLREPLRTEPRWIDDPDAFAAWQGGRTGFPLVDAGMRQLLSEGWMPNRVRMVAASVLTKHLAIDWRLGAWHFMDHLVDGDLANNFGGWQWAAGTGIDTRPNRIFNPHAQSRRYDPDGSYVRRWVPELARLGAPEVHEPWAGGRPHPLAGDYPAPLIDQAEARARLAERSKA